MNEKEIKIFKEGIAEIKSKKYCTVWTNSTLVNKGTWFNETKYTKILNGFKRNF